MKIITGRPGRPREFDIEVATLDAMEVFWQNGFHATSLPDLIEGMGLTRGSIYKAYDDKRSIYLAALDTYTETMLSQLDQDLSRADKKLAVRDVLRRAAKNHSAAIGRKGCFATAATIEMVPNDPEVQERVAELYDTMETRLCTAIDAGKAGGSITTKTQTASLAKFLVCTIEGMCVLGKLGPTERSNQKFVNIALSLLE